MGPNPEWAGTVFEAFHRIWRSAKARVRLSSPQLRGDPGTSSSQSCSEDLGGAFTGARKEGMVGKIQQADGGTPFLDEIGDMPFDLQARSRRVLQERCVTPLRGRQAEPRTFL